MADEATEQLLGIWYGRLQPDNSLDVAQNEQDRAWYVDLDDGVGLRGPSAVEGIVRGIRASARLPEGASTHLFAGFRGTGKSTELGRLARELQQQGDPGFSVLRVNARKYHSLSKALSIEELAVLLAAGIGEAALETLGEQALPRLSRTGVWERVHTLLRKVIDEKGVTFKLGFADIKPALFEGRGLREQLREALDQQGQAKLQEFLHQFVLEIATAIQPRQLVILVDDLDKYTVPKHRVAEVYREMADVFFHHGALLKLPAAHTIYTVPPYLAFLNQEIAGVFGGFLHVLPSVKVQGRPPERAPFPEGLAALARVIGRRVDLDKLFGPAQDECMARLALASGGNLRDLESLMRKVIEVAFDDPLPLGMSQVQRVISQQGAIRTLLKNDFDLLLEVSKHGDLDRIPEDQIGAFAGAMDQHLMLCYWNGEFWYDAHPIVAHKLQRVREASSPGMADG